MPEIEKRARVQLMVIEQAYGLRIQNREEVARLIARRVRDLKQVLSICSALNSWVALNSKAEVCIPLEVLEPLLKLAEWQENNR
jgi:hypothetical protein